jgi:hypothetical protein
MTAEPAAGTIRSLTPTLCALFGVEPPALSSEPPLRAVVGDARPGLRTPIARALVYCPDAIGDHVWERFPEHAARLASRWQRVRVTSMTPPKTPVCYASVFTGGTPEQHGITQPRRPTLSCDTLFDAMVRSGKRVAIATVRGSSIDLLFRGRALTYFTEPYDAGATARALELIERDEHDLIVLYNQEYDDALHRTQPLSAECRSALANHFSTIDRISDAVDACWRRHDSATVLAPDHGAHLDAETGKGDHGLDIPEDMSVSHWYRIQRAEARAGEQSSP